MAEVKFSRHRVWFWRVFVVLSGWWLLTSNPQQRDVLGEVEALGELRVATINGPFTIFQTGAGRTGFEYDLVSQLAQDLGVEARWQVYSTLDEARQAVERGNAHLLAAALSAQREDEQPQVSPDTGNPKVALLQSYPYRFAQYRVVFTKAERPRPRHLSDLGAVKIAVPQSALLAVLDDAGLGEQAELTELPAHELLDEVATGKRRYALVDSDSLLLAQRNHDNLRDGIEVGEPLSKVWRIARGGESLLVKVNTFLRFLEAEGKLALIHDRHFEHLGRLDGFSTNAFRERVENRLPKYRAFFEKSAQQFNMDWRFLAAVSYQESSWNEKAVSATGVRGLMMLTRAAAKDMGVKRRTDPAQSIEGGARYFRGLHARVAPDAPEPDRTWMALAAYNLGLGHVRDLQKLTHSLGGEPNRWIDMRDNLAKLSQPRWYKQLKYGYARGGEALAYVANIRAYYDLLRWLFPDPGERELNVEQPLRPFDIELPSAQRKMPEILVPGL